MSRRWRPAVAPLVFVLAAACAHRPPSAPAPRFADSEAFAEVRGRAFGILERDVDGDGLIDAVVALQVAGGWAATAFAHTANEAGHAWRRTCQGPSVAGSELGHLAWVEMGDGPLVVVVGVEENPDELVQAIVLVDPSDACEPRLEERLVLVKPAGDVLAPGPVPAGVLLRDGVLVLSDRPKTVTLNGPEGTTSLLMEVRLRRISGTREHVEVAEGTVTFLEPREISATWQSGAEPMTLEMLSDGNDVTGFVARAEEAGTLRLEANDVIDVLILHHGCRRVADSRLELRVGEGNAWVLGSPVPPDAFVRAAGRSHGRGDVRLDLLALREATRTLSLQLGPVDLARCVREVRAFGFKSSQ